MWRHHLPPKSQELAPAQDMNHSKWLSLRQASMDTRPQPGDTESHTAHTHPGGGRLALSLGLCAISGPCAGGCWLSSHLPHSVGSTPPSQFTLESSRTPPVLTPHFHGERFLLRPMASALRGAAVSHHVHLHKPVPAPAPLTCLPEYLLVLWVSTPAPFSLLSIQKPGILLKVTFYHPSTQNPPMTTQLTCKLRKIKKAYKVP